MILMDDIDVINIVDDIDGDVLPERERERDRVCV